MIIHLVCVRENTFKQLGEIVPKTNSAHIEVFLKSLFGTSAQNKYLPDTTRHLLNCYMHFGFGQCVNKTDEHKNTSAETADIQQHARLQTAGCKT